MSLDELDPGDRMMVEGLYWWGPATLFRCPVDPDPAGCDIALVGVPHASGNASTERDQHLGPRAVRHVSAVQRRYHAAFGFSPWETCRIHDLGDVAVPRGERQRALHRADHGLLRARSPRPERPPWRSEATTRSPAGSSRGWRAEGSKLTGDRKVALLHLDAHIDAYESIPHWLGAKKSAAHWATTSSARARSTRRTASRSASAAIREPPTGCSRATTWATKSSRSTATASSVRSTASS